MATPISDKELPRSRWHVQIRWNHENRDKRKAHRLVAAALRKGTLKRGVCEDCGSLRVEAHHPDYAKPLDVVWLCRRDHLRRHAAMRKDAA